MNGIWLLFASILLHCGLIDMQEMKNAPLNLYVTKNNVKKLTRANENMPDGNLDFIGKQ